MQIFVRTFMANLQLISQFSDKVKYFIASYTHFSNQTISIPEREHHCLVSLQPHSTASSSTTTLTQIGVTVTDLGVNNHMMGGNSGLPHSFVISSYMSLNFLYLLSISKITKTPNYATILLPPSCVFQDLKTGVNMCGRCENLVEFITQTMVTFVVFKILRPFFYKEQDWENFFFGQVIRLLFYYFYKISCHYGI